MSTIQKQLLAEAIFNTKFTNGTLRYDFTQLVNNGKFISEVADELKKRLDEFDADTVIGSGYGGAQLCTAVTAKFPTINSIIVRSTPHAKQENRQVEGNVHSPKRVVILDDAIFSGNSIRELLAIITPALKAKIVGVVTLFDNWEPLGSRQLEQQYFPIKSLVHRHDLGLTRDARPTKAKCKVKKLFLTPEQLKWADYDGGNTAVEWTMKSSPIFHQQLLINVTDRYVITAYNKQTGNIVWRQNLPGAIRPNPYTKGVVQTLSVAADGFMYVAAYDGAVIKLDPLTGDVLWRVKADICVHSTPVLLNENDVIVNTESYQRKTKVGGGYVKCLDALTGHVKWQYKHNEFPPATVTRVNDTEFIATANDGQVVKLDNTGKLLWATTTKNEVKSSGLLHEGHIYLVDNLGWLHKLDVATGKQVWVIRGCSNGWLVTPIFYQGLIVVWDAQTVNARACIHGYNPITARREWLGWLRHGTASVTQLDEDALLVVSSATQLAYFHGLNKEWEANYTIPGSRLYSQIAYDPKSGLAAFNLTLGGLQVYKFK